MSNNPYEATAIDYGSVQSGYPQSPGDALKVPASILLVLAIVWLVLLLLAFLLNVVVLATGMANQSQETGNLGISAETRIAIRMGWNFLMMCCNGVTVAGSLAMLRRSSWTMSLVGAISATIPCLGPCYVFGIPFAVWAMIAMARPEIKSSFRS